MERRIEGKDFVLRQTWETKKNFQLWNHELKLSVLLHFTEHNNILLFYNWS